MRWDDTALMAYVHGELDAVEAKRIEAAMAADPDLARRIRSFRAARQALIVAYQSVASQPIPEEWKRMLDAIEHPDDVPKTPSMFDRQRGKPH